MAVRSILRMGDPRLLEPARAVTDFATPALQALIVDMFDTMAEAGGVGLAAPQIGVGLQVVIFGFDASERYPDAEAVPQTILINPLITPLGDEEVLDWEGCLSVPGLRGEVPRFARIRYQGLDPSGQLIDRTVDGFHARVVQHECDHLVGMLYPMRIRDFRRFGFTDVLFPARKGAESEVEDPVVEKLLPAIEIESGENPQYAVIWLHGLGADGSDFVPVIPELGLSQSPAIRFIFPHAPEMAVTCNNGYVMPAWYDIISLDSTSRKIDEAGIVRSRAAIRQLIARENERGIPCNRIFLAGFSQGGAVVYTTALTHPEPLAGIIALSTYLPTVELVSREMADANRATPVFIGHGSVDDVVSPELGERARDFLIENNYPLEWHEYPIPHSVCLEEIQAIGAWLRGRLA
jgi:phospholipase/carboxylesterase